MNYFTNEKFDEKDYVHLSLANKALLIQNAILLDQIDELERACYFFKTVDKAHREKFGAI